MIEFPHASEVGVDNMPKRTRLKRGMPDIALVRKRIRKLKVGDEVSYNVVDESGFYNVDGEVIKVHKDGSVDVDTGWKVDKRVDPEMVAFGETYPAGVITIKTKKRK